MDSTKHNCYGFNNLSKVLDLNAYVISVSELGLNIALAYICPHHPHEGFKNDINSKKLFLQKPFQLFFKHQ